MGAALTDVRDAGARLFIEPFCGGSHRAFAAALTSQAAGSWRLIEQPARHWKWRSRSSALHAAEALADDRTEYELLCATSMFPLAELGGLVPRLATVPKVLYFHENQFAYPNREAWSGERDHHFAFNQVISAAAADVCVFNSAWNRASFFAGARAFVARMPDARPTAALQRAEDSAKVLPLPLDLSDRPVVTGGDADRARGPVILWNHRWEHDKDPGRFFRALETLSARGVPFRLVVCGESFRDNPPEFARAQTTLADHIDHFGTLASRADYLALLDRCDLTVSTAVHEFFGIAVLEATHHGARPVVPDDLAYPEHFPAEYRYATDADLADVLEPLCRGYAVGELDLRGDRRALTEGYRADRVIPAYDSLFAALVAGS